MAVGAGLLRWDDLGQPQFVGDAIADPLTGVYAALAVAESLAEGRSGLMDFPWLESPATVGNRYWRRGATLFVPCWLSPSANQKRLAQWLRRGSASG